ncbi:MAG: hypothetical protein LC731_07210 [Acidobacteria bacterium]|nr:hypothetical protein [Acidobacteriota bacterium]
MAEGNSEGLLGSEESAMHVCERCDQPRRHLIKFMGADNRPHYVCWSCSNREDKHINLKSTWRRAGRKP